MMLFFKKKQYSCVSEFDVEYMNNGSTLRIIVFVGPFELCVNTESRLVHGGQERRDTSSKLLFVCLFGKC